jgi:ParB family chromosome partitioning protein
MKFELIPLEIIDPNPYQPRLQMDQEKTEDLARGIRIKRKQLPDTLGLMQVPIARWVNGRVQLAFGHRRCEAFRINQTEHGDDWSKMPLQLVDLSDEEMYDLAARENGDREDINPIERAQSILDAKEKFGWNLQRAASAHGLSKSAASNLTRLLQLPDAVTKMVSSGDLEQRKARELVRLMQIEPPQPEKCIELARKIVEEGTVTSMVEYKVKNVIYSLEELQKLRQEMSEAVCPYCDHVGLTVNDSESVSCPNCRPYRSWPTKYDYIKDKFDREQQQVKKNIQAEAEPVASKSEAEQMAEHKHERYCKHCNHKQTVNGAQVFKSASVRCRTCGKVEAVGWGGWLKEPKPEPVANDKPKPAPAAPIWREIPDTAETCYLCDQPADFHNNGHRNETGADYHLCTAHHVEFYDLVTGHTEETTLRAALERCRTIYTQRLLPASTIKRSSFPAACPTGQATPICMANCLGCDHHRQTERGTWLCYHPIHQDQLSLPGIEEAEELPVFPENGAAIEPEPHYSIFECPHCNEKLTRRLMGGAYQCDGCEAKWPSSKDFMREVHQATTQRNKKERIRGLITGAAQLQHELMKLPATDNQFVQQLNAKISQVISDLETLETQADVVFKETV